MFTFRKSLKVVFSLYENMVACYGYFLIKKLIKKYIDILILISIFTKKYIHLGLTVNS